MKYFLQYVFSVLIFSAVLTGAFWLYLSPQNHQKYSLTSPLPDFQMLTKNNQVRMLDIWSPLVQKTYGSGFDTSQMTAQSVLMYDLTENKTIFEKASETRRPMASLTKIMTAIISLENKRSDDRYTVHPENIVGEDSMGVTAGEVLSQEDLLYGLMLPSGNDAAEVLATNYPAGRDAFIQAMNDKAASLGLKNTHFDNPSGLQGDGIQYTTAADLLVITRYALDNFPLFKKIVSSAEHQIPVSNTHKAYDLFNETNLLTTYEGVHGVKTGYTPEAGLCLVTYYSAHGHDMIGIILDSENRRGEMKELLDNSLKSLGIQPPEYKG